MQGLCAEKKAIGPRKSLDCSTLQSIADKESANRDQARERRGGELGASLCAEERQWVSSEFLGRFVRLEDVEIRDDTPLGR